MPEMNWAVLHLSCTARIAVGDGAVLGAQPAAAPLGFAPLNPCLHSAAVSGLLLVRVKFSLFQLDEKSFLYFLAFIESDFQLA